MAPIRIVEVGYLIDSVVVVVSMAMLLTELMRDLGPRATGFDLYLCLMHLFLPVLSSFFFFF